jgi:ribosomal protein S18 acetylase RimI-like enzyme
MEKDINIQLFPVKPQDLDAILEVYRQCEDFLALGPVPYASLAMVETDLATSRDNNGVFCGIYTPEGEMAGIVDYIPSGFEDQRNQAFLELLMIAAPWRSHGIGDAVVRQVEALICQDPQITAILSGVQVNNPGAIRFWLRQGYTIVSGPQDFPDGTTAFRLYKGVKSEG